jgi:hypothetical protein
MRQLCLMGNDWIDCGSLIKIVFFVCFHVTAVGLRPICHQNLQNSNDKEHGVLLLNRYEICLNISYTVDIVLN